MAVVCLWNVAALWKVCETTDMYFQLRRPAALGVYDDRKGRNIPVSEKRAASNYRITEWRP